MPTTIADRTRRPAAPATRRARLRAAVAEAGVFLAGLGLALPLILPFA